MISRRWYLLLIPCLMVILMGEDGCENSTSRELVEVERQQLQYVRNQPTPQFDWSLERHLLTELYNARNNAVATYSYVRNQYTGSIMSSCPSIGFPISAATQLTNPMKFYATGVALPQSEPNGLFSQADSRGTWVMCVNEAGQVEPRYYEQDVETYVTPMREENGTLVKVPGMKASLTIDPKRK